MQKMRINFSNFPETYSLLTALSSPIYALSETMRQSRDIWLPWASDCRETVFFWQHTQYDDTVYLENVETSMRDV